MSVWWSWYRKRKARSIRSWIQQEPTVNFHSTVVFLDFSLDRAQLLTSHTVSAVGHWYKMKHTSITKTRVSIYPTKWSFRLQVLELNCTEWQRGLYQVESFLNKISLNSKYAPLIQKTIYCNSNWMLDVSPRKLRLKLWQSGDSSVSSNSSLHLG